MDLFELVATLNLDTTSFISGITGALSTALGYVKDFSVDVVNTGMGFDKEMSAAQAVFGETDETMARLREHALQTARDSIFTSEETAKAYYYMGMAGWSADEAVAGLSGVMALAAASGEDLKTVSDIVTDDLTAFGWEASQAGEFVDILAQAATNSNTDVRRMGQTFKYIAPIASALGVDVEDIALATSLLASQSIKGSMAGTALRNILTRITTNAGATSTALGATDIMTEKLGVQIWDASGKMRDFSDIIMESRVAWRNLSQEEQTYYAKQIGSQRGMAAWMALMNASEEDVEQLTYAFENAEGAAQRMADVKLDNLWGDLQMLNSSVDVLKVTLFDEVKGPLREVVQYVTGAIDRIRDSAEEGGLTGFIKQIGTEIRAFSDEYKDDIEELASSLVPLLTTIFTALAPALTEAAIQLGVALGKGIVQGILQEVQGGATNGSPIINLLTGGSFFGSPTSSVVDAFLGRGSSQGQTVSVTDFQYGDESITIPAELQVTSDDIQAAITEAENDGAAMLQIKGVWMSTDAANALLDSLSSVGTDAGRSVAGDIQSELNHTNFSVNVTGFVQTVFGGVSSGWRTEKHARSMFGGSILRGATVFGMNSDGRPMVGGAEGPEAVVGTGSLDQMIRSSVSGAMGNVLSRLDTMVSRVTSYSPKFYLDTGALVGGTVNGMNRELNNVAVWKGFGRA